MSFIHEFGDSENHSVDTAFHRAVDRVFYRIRTWLTDNDAAPFEWLADAILNLLWGFNCKFPRRDVILYVIWGLRGYTPTML